MQEKRTLVQSFHKVIHGIIIGVMCQIISYTEPPGKVIAGIFTLSMDARARSKMVTTPTNLDLCCPDARARPADLQRSSTFISCTGAVWVGLEFFQSLPENSKERSDIDPSANVSCL